MPVKVKKVEWKVHTVGLLNEILVNPGTGILKRPLQIFGVILEQVAKRASQLNDSELNKLMCRLALYAIADPTDKKNYDEKAVERILNHKNKTKKPSSRKIKIKST